MINQVSDKYLGVFTHLLRVLQACMHSGLILQLSFSCLKNVDKTIAEAIGNL